MKILFNENVKWGRKPQERKETVEKLYVRFGLLVSRKDLTYLIQNDIIKFNDITWLLQNKQYRTTTRGMYDLSSLIEGVESSRTVEEVLSV